MTGNQPGAVEGYKTQDTDAIALVDMNKGHEERILRLLNELASLSDLPIDKRWLAIGRTHIEQGFMAVNRAILKPVRVSLPEDGASINECSE